MPELNKKFFRGPTDLPSERIPDLLTKRSDKDVEDTLTRLGWEGQLIAGISLKVSPDGRSTASGSFLLRGALCQEPIQIQAAKLWEKAATDILLTINVPNGADLIFAGGKLYSEFVDSDRVRFQVSKGDQVLDEKDWQDKGVGEFCLRVVTQLGKTSNGNSGPHIEFMLLVHPLSVDRLLELSDATQSPTWPGIKALEGQCGFFPVTPGGLWAAPFFPLLDVQQRAANVKDTPPGDRILFAMAAIMRTAAKPTACTNLNGLKRQMDKIMKDQEAAAPSAPSIYWPVAREPAGEKGRKLT